MYIGMYGFWFQETSNIVVKRSVNHDPYCNIIKVAWTGTGLGLPSEVNPLSRMAY